MSHINGGMVTVNGVYLLQNQPAQGTGGVTFYNPAQFTQVALLQPAIVLRELLFESPPLTVFFLTVFPQTSAAPGGGQRSGRLGGQRQYPVLK